MVSAEEMCVVGVKSQKSLRSKSSQSRNNIRIQQIDDKDQKVDKVNQRIKFLSLQKTLRLVPSSNQEDLNT